MPKNRNNRNRNRQQRNRQQRNKQSKQRKPKIKNPLYDPSQPLAGKALKKAVKSMVRAQTRPQIRAYERQEQALRGLLEQQTGALGRLGANATGRVTDYYKQLAQGEAQNVARSKALANRVQTATGNIASNTQTQIGQAGEVARQQLANDPTMQAQVVPSSARQQLEQLVAQQQGAAAREGQALQGHAVSRGQDWQAVAAGMAQANQMRGAQNISDLQRTIQQRIGEVQSEITPDIREAIAAAADVRAGKGDLRTQLLEQLRGGEREYGLSRAALKLDKQTAKAARQGKTPESREKAKWRRHDRRMTRLRAKIKKAEQERNFELQKKLTKEYNKLDRQKKNRSERLMNQQRGGGGSSKVPMKRQVRQGIDKARQLGQLNKVTTKKDYDWLVSYLTQGGRSGSQISRQAAIRVANRLTPYGKRKSGKKRNDPNKWHGWGRT